MLPAKTAPKRLEQPMKSSLDGIPGVYHSKIDRLAVGTVGSDETHCGAHDQGATTFA